MHHAGDALAMPQPQPGRGLRPGRRRHDPQGDLCQRSGRGRRTNLAHLEDRRSARIQPVQSRTGSQHEALQSVTRCQIFIEEEIPLDQTHRIQRRTARSTRCWASAAQSGSENCKSSTPKRRPGRILRMVEPSVVQGVEQHEDATL